MYFLTKTMYSIWFEVAMTTFMSSLCLNMTHTFFDLHHILFLSFDACCNNIFLILKHAFIYSLFVSLMSSVFLLFFVFFCFLFWFLSCSQSPFSLHFIFIFCYLPSYPNFNLFLIYFNLFLIYFRNHFFFYSNQIIPFLFYFYFYLYEVLNN